MAKAKNKKKARSTSSGQAAKKKVKAPAKASVKKSALGTPYGNRVLVKPAKVEQTTSFGLILPDSGKLTPETGVVVAVGNGRRTSDGNLTPIDVNVGDTIMFNKYGYDEVKINGEEYFLISEDSVTYIF
ncbi:MAG TPA: co-chaperone GroES [Candidatus Paceibacterota bacterium]|nr:co-chaperone GroES [Candidatus Paceibacterota bacterium]